MLKIGRAIRTLRVHKGSTQIDLAARAGITAAFLSLVERDRRNPSIKVLERIAAALNITPELLIWDAVELPSTLSEEDHYVCEHAKIIIRKIYNKKDGE